MTGALDGLKVLDLTRVLAGPFCTMMLGDMGADIVKVEPPGGDETRGWGPPFAGGEAAYFLAVNRNKRSIVLDLTTDDGRETLAALIRRSDVLIENYRAGTLEKWGFGAAWREANAPRLVHCSITGYGTPGPNANLPGYDYVLQGETGLMSITGEVGGEPMKHGMAIVDLATGLFAAVGILGALQSRHVTGRGQTISASLFESGLALLANVASNHFVSGKPAGRFGNGHPSIVPYQTFCAADASLVVAVGNDGQFARLAAVAGHPEWAADPRFATNSARVANREACEALIAEAMALAPAKAWLDRLRAAGVPCGPVNSVEQALADPNTVARDMVVEMEHAKAGLLRMLGAPFKMSGTPNAATRPPPLLGEHTQEILAELRADTAANAASRAL